MTQAAQIINIGSYFDEAKRVLKLEADAIYKLADSLDSSFSKAIEFMGEVKGRIIVTGMGKSGHIARKMAATFASTGSAAYFVHPSEASHGDLGMISSGDLVIALSNSGETKELSDLIAYTRRFSVPLVAITSKADSALGSAADITLTLPKAPEACPLRLAPTTSTTLMLALGDAIALALMQEKNFSATDFHTYHPGGKLGKQLLRVQDLMRVEDELPLVTEMDTMSQVILEMTEKTFGCVGVVNDQGQLIGIITDGDLRRHMGENLLTLKAQDIMSKDPKTIEPSTLAVEALAIMNEKAITCLFVTDGKIKGLLRMHDCLKAGIA
jgi:arabinose-5-phosphate isomerase